MPLYTNPLTLLSPHLSSKLVSVFRALESQEIDIFQKQTLGFVMQKLSQINHPEDGKSLVME